MIKSQPVDESAIIAAMRSIDAPAVRTPVESEKQQWAVRRWESALTDRLNQAHWQNATGQPINADLNFHLDTLRTRCFYEAANNSIVEGVISTHVCDVVGPNGPRLQVQSESDAYNEALEQLFEDWWALPDFNGELSGVEFLELWIRMLWCAGEYTTQRQSALSTRRMPVTLRLLNFHPERLKTPMDHIGDPNIVMGIRVTDTGRPLTYFVNDPKPMGPYMFDDGKYKPVDASLMIHRFRTGEPHQLRGVPWLAPSLQPIADLRDFGVQTLDAARQAADFAIVLSATGPEANYIEVNESVEIERRRMVTAPPGWQPHAMRPEQPTTTYVQFTREKLREIGRPVNMPLIIVLLDAGEHNYSSARFDNLPYWRGIVQLQEWIARRTLNPLVDEVSSEGRIADVLPPRPDRVSYSWTWTRPEHVDPDKESKADNANLGKTMSLTRLLASKGQTLEQWIDERVREDRQLASAGLPTVPEMIQEAAEPIAEEADEEVVGV